ncbi:hypothetical protein NMY22_g17611 [Coprinellus aureogranulatus]|nr:hypothetical protein NMY22_g17611 [Coprinellus aureogranulatus]
MLDDFKFWFQTLFIKRTVPPPLERMQLRPVESTANPLMIQFFTWDCLHPDMSWWRHLEEEIPKLAEQGYTQIWLPPPNKAAELDGRGYDAYDLWDLGEFMHKGEIRTRWGTRDELLSACRTARQHGIDVLIDAVLNHKLGADRHETFRAVPSNPNNRLRDDGPPRLIDVSTLSLLRREGGINFAAGLDSLRLPHTRRQIQFLPLETGTLLR